MWCLKSCYQSKLKLLCNWHRSSAEHLFELDFGNYFETEV